MAFFSYTFLQLTTLISGVVVAHFLARLKPSWWMCLISIVLSVILCWVAGIILWASLFVSDSYTAAIASAMPQSFLFAVLGPALGVMTVKKRNSLLSISSNRTDDEFISGFHGLPNTKDIGQMSTIQLTAMLSESSGDSPKRLLLENEVKRREIASHSRATAIISITSAVVGAVIGAVFSFAIQQNSSTTAVEQVFRQFPTSQEECIPLTPEEDEDYNIFDKFSPNPAEGYASVGYYNYLENKYTNYRNCIDRGQ